MINKRKKSRAFTVIITVLACVAAVVFLLPTVLTIANSFMTSNERVVYPPQHSFLKA